MLIIILVIAFVALYLNISTRVRVKYNSLLLTVLVFCLTIVVVTEALSIVKQLRHISILSFWIIFSLANILLIAKNKSNVLQQIRQLQCRLLSLKQFTMYQKVTIGIITGILLLLFLQGVIYPPNNWDSLTYHMSRIMYWIGNQSVEHYPARIIREIYQPPFAEYVILHFNILSGSDRFSNAVQLLFLVFTAYAAVAICRQMTLPRHLKIFAVLLIITLPEGLLQATNTKNDIVVSFFILATVYYSTECIRKVSIANFCLLGLSVGLAAFTKATAYLYLAPVLLIFGFRMVQAVIKRRNYKIVLYAFAAGILALLINSGHFYRNYALNHNILKIDNVEADGLINQKMSPKLLLSCMAKNAAIHMGPAPLNQIGKKGVASIHSKLNLDINKPGSNYFDMPYENARDITTHEDYVPNTIHFVILNLCMALALLFIIISKKNRWALLAGVFVISAQIILFCGYLKWQPWHTRLHLPIFVTGVLLIVYCMAQKKWLTGILLRTTEILMLSSVFVLAYNNTRPLLNHPAITGAVTATDNHYKKYFANQPHLYAEYGKVVDKMRFSGFKKIGLEMIDWEYPVLCTFYTEGIKPIAVNVVNVTAQIQTPQVTPDCIISNMNNQPEINFNNNNYINLTAENKFLWIYARKK